MTTKLNENIKQKIIDFLKDKNIGASSSEISKAIKHNRITISKYLEIMNALNILNYKTIAQAKIWSINKSELKKKILVVDDEQYIVNLIKLSLKQDKYKIIKSYNGEEAIKTAEINMPDLIILDLMMPGMNGFEVCQQIRKNPRLKDCKIIILSAKNEIENKFKGLDLGADDYITKPFDPEELEKRIENLLSTNEREINPVTGLPNKNQLLQYLKQNNIEQLKLITINNYEIYKNKFGIRSSDKIVKLLSRLLQDRIKDDLSSYIAHIDDNKFIVISKLSNLNKEIQDSFEKIIPYIYHKKQCNKKLSLNIKNIKKKDIIN